MLQVYSVLFCQQADLSNLESKLRGLENDLLLNQITIEKIKEAVKQMQKEQVRQLGVKVGSL
jgi:hypothetical protein